MNFIQGTDRQQATLFPQCLDEIIEADNEARMIDLFVESIDLKPFQFVYKTTTEGRPAYNPKDLLKLFIYGYLHSIRSSRMLEKQCKINIEVMWLMKELAPDHNTISNFRRDNPKAIRKVFQQTVAIAKHFNLIGGKLIAGDSTKLRAQNSKKNNFNEKKIIQHIEYIDKKLMEYTEAMALADEDNKKNIQEQIEKQEKRKQKYNDLSRQLAETGETQVSTSDPESRQMITRNNITEVAYNVQSVTDAKHCIPIDYKVTNQNDSKAMGVMVRRSKCILGTADFTALFDKGYHTGSELKTAIEAGVHTLVAPPGVASFAPNENYNFDKFIYDSINDTYICPQNETLVTNGNCYQKSKQRYIYFVRHYKTNKCATCSALAQCTKNKKGRLIERSEYQPYMDANKSNIEADPETYKKSKSIIENNYVILKRQWGFYYVCTKKGMKRASSDVGLMFCAYNLRRLLNLIDPNQLQAYLEALSFIHFKQTDLYHHILNCNFMLIKMNKKPDPKTSLVLKASQAA